MSFNEANVNREEDGRFGEKTGSPANVSLAPVVYGGRFGVRLPLVQPTDEDYAEAREALGIGADAELVGNQPAHVEGQAQHLARRHDPLRAFDEGRGHYLDDTLDAMWRGEGGGYSEEMFQKHLDWTRDTRAQYESGKMSAQRVIGSSSSEDMSEAASAYLDEMENKYSEALRSHGRSFGLNVDSAYAAYHRPPVEPEDTL